MIFRPVVAIAALSLILIGATSSNSRAAEVVVLSTVAAKSVLEEIAPAFERDSNHKLVLRFATAAELKAEIEKGAPCDVALLTVAAVDDLIKQGRFTQISKINVAKSGVGIAVKRGAAAPSITTGEELKQALLSAKSIVYSAQGATAPIMKRIFERFGITEVMSAKTIVVTAITAPEAVASGQAEMGFTQISEILDTPSTRLVGPLPPEVQVYSSFAAAIATEAKAPGAAQAFIDLLVTAATKAVLKARGLEPN
ncbi:substrate-binding domain-containing protein [Collimonas sp.]|jgi:molybdate transport system substrate-binding protein|uniref:molybdate ABC transporter substrate-binding protein n=1 Tax=Collimonas sp. TaxID=1963772 RepID=UPI002B50B6A1|nr:substrate-binding domain-containing protein [Collimonas sp.]HWW03919.1 substrate-binding domain-containing protein [Collimonas sp.]